MEDTKTDRSHWSLLAARQLLAVRIPAGIRFSAASSWLPETEPFSRTDPSVSCRRTFVFCSPVTVSSAGSRVCHANMRTPDDTEETRSHVICIYMQENQRHVECGGWSAPSDPPPGPSPFVMVEAQTGRTLQHSRAGPRR
ncbi:hypothetical protein OJAV_G00085030 [Oryzias javanicus]|uniref:Uncharacterized protein n=1 Tax=Oryzias javanicus TaxID=123683 RepID=A0A3S2MID1_ORYJA|nr:hypothetical protein OJAV_G00085030 [Oryzias javanicus]